MPGVFCYDMEFKCGIIPKTLKISAQAENRPQNFKHLTDGQLLVIEEVQP